MCIYIYMCVCVYHCINIWVCTYHVYTEKLCIYDMLIYLNLYISIHVIYVKCILMCIYRSDYIYIYYMYTYRYHHISGWKWASAMGISPRHQGRSGANGFALPKGSSVEAVGQHRVHPWRTMVKREIPKWRANFRHRNFIQFLWLILGLG